MAEPGTSVDPDSDDFDVVWREFFRQQRDRLDLVRAVIRLTEAGAHPVEISRLAAVVDKPPDLIRQLVDEADAGMPSLHIGHAGDQVWLDLATKETPRFWYQIGARRIGVAGCGPDIFGVAQALDEPMSAEATCPVTGVRIAVELTPDGVRSVQPADTVVAVLHLGAVAEAAELTDSARVDAEVCTQQTFFANAAAAESWLRLHPGGKVMLVTDFDRWLRRLHSSVVQDRSMTDSTPGNQGV